MPMQSSLRQLSLYLRYATRRHPMLDDLRHLPRNDEPFQIISEETAGNILLVLVGLLVLADILWRYS